MRPRVVRYSQLRAETFLLGWYLVGTRPTYQYPSYEQLNPKFSLSTCQNAPSLWCPLRGGCCSRPCGPAHLATVVAIKPTFSPLPSLHGLRVHEAKRKSMASPDRPCVPFPYHIAVVAAVHCFGGRDGPVLPRTFRREGHERKRPKSILTRCVYDEGEHRTLTCHIRPSFIYSPELPWLSAKCPPHNLSRPGRLCLSSLYKSSQSNT